MCWDLHSGHSIVNVRFLDEFISLVIVFHISNQQRLFFYYAYNQKV